MWDGQFEPTGYFDAVEIHGKASDSEIVLILEYGPQNILVGGLVLYP